MPSRSPPGGENGTVKPELGGGQGGRGMEGPISGKRMALVKAIVPSRSSCSGKNGENIVRNPRLHSEKKCHHFFRAIALGVGKRLKKSNMAK